MGDRRWREPLETINGAVRRELERFRGRAVKSMGDGFLVRRARARDPLRHVDPRVGRGAVRPGGAQWPAHREIELIGEDVGGIAVHIGARVGASAGPGEVLVSGTVKDLVVGSGISFEDCGERELKGVPGRWRLWAVSG